MNSQKAGGPHYSPFVVGNGFIFVSGQLPLLPGRETSLATAPFASQAEQALCNLKAVLADAGAGLEQVVKTPVYIADVADWGELDAVYGRFFGAARPARSVVPSGSLQCGVRIVSEAIALGAEAKP